MEKIAMIPAAGRGSRMLSLTENNPKAMLPFNSKPIIGHHLDYLIDSGFKKVVIIVGYQKEKLMNYVNQFYADKIEIRFTEQKELNGLATAVYRGIQVLTLEEKLHNSLFIVLGDIILQTTIPGSAFTENFIGYDIVEDWSRWCMVRVEDGEVKEFIDKPEHKPDTNKNAMGIYNVTNIEHLEQCLLKSFLRPTIRNEFQISTALELYLNKKDILAFHISKYYDLGELDALNKTRQNITRHFNSITPTDDGTIIKSSLNITKIQKEIDWFVHLDMDLSLYVPHLVNFDYKKGTYELEFIHSSPLQELYLFNLPEKYQWEKIFKTIRKYIRKSWISQNQQNIDQDNRQILIKKTQDRVKELEKCDFTKEDFVVINNIVYKNPVKNLAKILSKTDKLLCRNTDSYFSRLHGDLFFGNMLYDVNTDVLKVIDPRGEYGRFSNFGDIRYDIAKLNHSVNGYYDFIVNGLYFLEEQDGKFFYHFYESKQQEVQEIFNKEILSSFSLDDIQLLTGLLFLTMIPLHSENPKNQKMQFIKAVEFLNKFI